MANRPPYPGTPRWVKVFGIIVVVVVVVVLLVVGLMFIGGEHGPGRHTPSGDAGGQVAASSIMEDHVSPEGGRV
jgi:ABC-type transporter Mla subunit MlaD